MEDTPQDVFKSLMTLVPMKIVGNKGYQGKAPLIYFPSKKWKAT